MEQAFLLKKKLTEAVLRNKADAILLSGGLDSAILASCASNIKAITVRFMEYGEDKDYSLSLARFLKMKHYQIKIDIAEALDAIPEVIKILKSFDPALPNDLVVYFGLLKAKRMGIKAVMTGDGSDELFAGYSFMQDIENLESYIKRIAERMNFSSNCLGEHFGIEIKQPYLYSEIVQLALKIPTSLKIKDDYGKWILRKAYEDTLPKDIVWQSKRPLEYGSGMTKIREIISLKVSDGEFKKKQIIYPVKFLNREHLYYYEIYRRIVGDIPVPKDGQKSCPGCKTGLEMDDFHCKICGYVNGGD